MTSPFSTGTKFYSRIVYNIEYSSVLLGMEELFKITEFLITCSFNFVEPYQVPCIIKTFTNIPQLYSNDANKWCLHTLFPTYYIDNY